MATDAKLTLRLSQWVTSNRFEAQCFWEKNTSEVCSWKRFNLHTCVRRHGRNDDQHLTTSMTQNHWITKFDMNSLICNLHLRSPLAKMPPHTPPSLLPCSLFSLVLGGLVLQQKTARKYIICWYGEKNAKIKEKKSFLIQASLGPSSDFGAPISSRFKKLSSSRKIGVDWAILRFHKPGKPGRYHIYGACFM